VLTAASSPESTAPNGTIGGDATLDHSVSATASVTANALFQIFGSDGAKTSAININGGNYNVGGTFEGFIDGNGIVTLNNATVAADTVKVGVFGSNGILRIGGGSISANTLLHLYAPASNGMIDFVANTTLNSPSERCRHRGKHRHGREWRGSHDWRFNAGKRVC
jgi:hypothetical protein